ncbi:hypothetical protein [Virgibacillus alimentarius]|uniref:Uncharacterized protein n=1 Tax=Virgibacillus alimentarius TaxID=698769 RepID=A0ABS4S7I4_9BACI|nr:hypothetical protein [Virgibacillus alimentarius]MBP2257457.1 hypothetical protein [Virgibacillus alimentarius]
MCRIIADKDKTGIRRRPTGGTNHRRSRGARGCINRSAWISTGKGMKSTGAR